MQVVVVLVEMINPQQEEQVVRVEVVLAEIVLVVLHLKMVQQELLRPVAAAVVLARVTMEHFLVILVAAVVQE
jgi:hypothetical protein